MEKLIVGFMVFFICLLAQNVCANPQYLEIYTEPPDAKYEVIGEVFHEAPVGDVEYIIVTGIGHRLQIKASELGANALIIRKMEKILKVWTEIENYDIDPFREINGISPYIRIEATAIKIEKAK